MTASPSYRLVTQPGAVDPHPVSLSTEVDRLIPKSTTNWDLFEQTINVVDAATTDREQLAHNLKLYDWWSIWNQLVFRSALKPNFLSVETAEYGKWLGQCSMAPVRQISISMAAYSYTKRLDSEGGAGHHGVAVNSEERPRQFNALQPLEWNACLVLLHEMMHDCLFSSVGMHAHEDANWGGLCNMIGRDVLGVPLNYGGLIKRKVPVLDKNGEVVMQPHANGKCDDEGNVIMVRKRITVWEWHGADFNNGFRNAEVNEMRCFPYLEDDPFIEMHTTVLGKGAAVRKNKGLPVFIPPQF